MSRNRTLVSLTAVVAAVALSTGAAGRASAQATASPAWAKQVCASLGSWVNTLETGASAASGATTAKAAKKSLTKFLAKAEGATSTVIGKVAKAGTPKVPDCKTAASLLRQQLAQVKKTIAQGKKQLAAAKGAQFVGGARGAQDGFEAGLESIQQALQSASQLDAAPLLAAFNARPACALVMADTDNADVSPASAAPGSEVSITPRSADADATEQCFGSSAFHTELLGADGARLATGEQSIAVPANAPGGAATALLVCYVPDDTGRRVIRGWCGSLTITGGTAATTAPKTGCPASPRLVLVESVIKAEAALSAGFNPVLSALGG
jgi:hypothetical protein